MQAEIYKVQKLEGTCVNYSFYTMKTLLMRDGTFLLVRTVVLILPISNWQEDL